MSRIRGRNTSPEVLLRRALWHAGLRYRLHAATPVGRPDVVIATIKLAVFVDGCQWHGCVEHYVFPRTRRDFWGAKLAENVNRDRRQTRDLEAQGWRVVRLWEHEIFTDLAGVTGRVLAAARSAGAEPLSWRVLQVDPQPGDEDLERRVLVELREKETQREELRRRTTRKWRRTTGTP